MADNNLSPGLMVAHSNRPEDLCALLVAWMRASPLSPLDTEVVLVQNNVMGQWLKLSLAADPGEGLAGGAGIAAGLETQLPGRFLWQIYRTVLGDEAIPKSSPLDQEQLVWRLMRLLPELISKPHFEPLRSYLERGKTEGFDQHKCYQMAQQLADLYDQYQVYRGDWLSLWEADDNKIYLSRNPIPQPLSVDKIWQAELWRELLHDLRLDSNTNSDEGRSGRAQIHQLFMAKMLSATPPERPAYFPQRVIIFGVSTLPQQMLEALATISRWTQVLLCVNNPSRNYWLDAIADRDLLKQNARRQTHRNAVPQCFSDDEVPQLFNPLLVAWGKQGRDYISMLEEFDTEQARLNYARYFEEIGQRMDTFEPNFPASSTSSMTLLHQVQNLILDASPVSELSTEERAIDPAMDGSVRFTIAHSALREVEILHDQLLARFNEDPTLKPRDVVVMVPNIDAYAPFIDAVFDLYDRTDQRSIPYCLVDRSHDQFDSMLKALRILVDLPHSRISAVEVTELLEVPAVRRRFAIDESAFKTITAWIQQANIRWGLHAEHYQSFDLPTEEEVVPNTWLFGLRRMLLGYAVGDEPDPTGGFWNEIAPFGEVGGLEVESLGLLVDLIERLDTTWQALRNRLTPDAWSTLLTQMLNDFFLADTAEEALTLTRIKEVLRDWSSQCEMARLTTKLDFVVIRDHLLKQVENDFKTAHFFAGAVTFGTLMPMRTLPFRMVCMLGMNDNDFPRQSVPHDFDLMSLDYRPGDRSRREDDRYLFLEALLAARERLYISWVGRSINDNTKRPPSVIVGQLQDHLATGWHLSTTETDSKNTLIEALTVEHPLQPFSLRYYSDQDNSPLFTYAHEWRTSNLETTSPKQGDRIVPLTPYQAPMALKLDELTAFFKSPVRQFMNKRLNVSFRSFYDSWVDHEPFELDALNQWVLKDNLIQTAKMNDNRVNSTALRKMLKQGELPAKNWGKLLANELTMLVEQLLQRYDAWLEKTTPSEHVAPIQLDALFANGGDKEPKVSVSLLDQLADFRRCSDGTWMRIELSTSNLSKNNKVRYNKIFPYWISHLASQLSKPTMTLVLSLQGDVCLNPIDSEQANEILHRYLQIWFEGMCFPLPFGLDTASDWWTEYAAQKGNDELAKREKANTSARKSYEGDGYYITGECVKQAELARFYPNYDALSSEQEDPALAPSFSELTRDVFEPLFQPNIVELIKAT